MEKIIWRFPPDLPKIGDRIFAHLRGYNYGDGIEIKVAEGENFSQIIRWCYYYEFKDPTQKEVV